jgi:fucose 4-O-acetylase-like acetyltransferase
MESASKAAVGGRSLLIDALRGYAIVLVVLGHVIQRSVGLVDWFAGTPGHAALVKTWWSVGLLSFGYWHMSLFMAVSGYLTFGHIKTPVGKWLNRKAAMLLVPFFSWMIVYYWVPDRFMNKGKSIVDYIWLTVQNPSNGLWYLFVLFVFYAITVMVESTGTGEWGLLAVGVGIAALPATGLFGASLMQWVWWWFAIGYVVAKYRERLLPWRWYIAGAALVVYPPAVYLLAHSHRAEYLPIVRLSGIVLSVLLVWVLVKLNAGRPMAFVGRRTLEIYAAEFLFVSLPVATGVARFGIVTAVAVLGSLLLGALLRLDPITNALFLGGRLRPSQPVSPPAQ